MEVSKLTFRKETKEQMTKQLSSRKKRAILYKRLQEIEKNGTLSKAENRYDVARLIGYPEEKISAGYAWVSRLVQDGEVAETLRGFKPNGKSIAEYHIAGDTTEAKTSETSKVSNAPEVSKVSTNEADTTTRPEATNSDIIRVEIIKGGVTVKIMFTNSKLVSELITTMLKGE